MTTFASSREKILAAVRASQPAETPLPMVSAFGDDNSIATFTARVQGIGGRVVVLTDLSELPATVEQLYPAGHCIASQLLPASVAVTLLTPASVLAGIDLAVLQGELGVAENGAIWVPEANMLHRALPTIAQHLVLVLDHRHVVATMHQAYARLAGVGGYGVFMAGPSKTADIEQSLVIGAHGARSLTVMLY